MEEPDQCTVSAESDHFVKATHRDVPNFPSASEWNSAIGGMSGT